MQAAISRRVFHRGAALAALSGGVGPWPELSARADVAAPLQFAAEWGQLGSAWGEFHSPIGIALDAHDRLYVTDTKNHRVQKFTVDGIWLGAFDVPRFGDPLYPTGGGVAIAADGRIYVSQMSTHQIVVLTPDGDLQRTWGRRGRQPGEFDNPGGIAFSPAGELYVADQSNHRVQVFSPEGEFLFQFGEFGSAPGQFGQGPPEVTTGRFGGPQFVTVDREGQVYTTESTLCRVQKLTARGEPILAWGDNSLEPGGFGGGHPKMPGPIGICLDAQDRVWVSGTFHRVQGYTPEGRFLQCLGGEEGSGPGEFSTPHGLVCDSAGRLFVVDSGNQRVQVFA